MTDHDIILAGRELPQKINVLLDTTDSFKQIVSSVSNSGIGEFKTFDSTSLSEIANEMAEIDRVTPVFGRKNSQTTNKLMSIVMLHGTDPYRSMRQCIAEVSNRRSAVRETYYNLLKKKVQISAMFDQYDKMLEGYEKQIAKIDIESLITETVETINYFEGALKDISNYLDAYNQIRKSYNIPENWDEMDFENEEIKGHVRHAFLLAYKDIMTRGLVDGGTVEYFHQFGIHPQRAIDDVVFYIENNKDDDYEDFEVWLDDMVAKYGNEYVKAMKRIGLIDLIDERSIYKGKQS